MNSRRKKKETTAIAQKIKSTKQTTNARALVDKGKNKEIKHTTRPST